MFYVYRFVNSVNHVIYVGKTKGSLSKRFKYHNHLPDECYQSVKKIEYIICKSEADMSIKEIYYINKYSHEGHTTYNLLDVSTPIEDIDLDDKWIHYKGFLPEWFSSTKNVIEGYVETKKTKYNLDGSIKRTTPNRKSGVSYDVLPLDDNEVKQVIDYYIDRIKKSPNKASEQQQFRNLIIFLTGIQYPIKINELLSLKYKDIFDCQNKVKQLQFSLKRMFKDYRFSFELDESLKSLYVFYAQKYNLSFASNSDDCLFLSRKHSAIQVASYNYILSEVINKLGLCKNVGGETLRKTYGLHIYNNSQDKIKALEFLEIILGQKGFGGTARYIGIIEKDYRIEELLTTTYDGLNIDIISKIE